MAGSLDGKVALVTGAGRNIGRAIALRLAQDGAAVVVNGRADQAAIEAVAAEIRELGGQAMDLPRRCLRTRPRLRAWRRRWRREWGGVDIAVSNAGLRRQTAFLDTRRRNGGGRRSRWTAPSSWRQAVVPQIIRRGGGSFVACRAFDPYRHAQPGACLGFQWPGWKGSCARSPWNWPRMASAATAWLRAASTRSAAPPPAPCRHCSAGIPLGRKGSVEEIAAIVRHAGGPEGGCIAGQTIHVNGGAFLAER